VARPVTGRALGLPQLLARSGVDLADGGDVAGQRFTAAPRVNGARSLDRMVAVARDVAGAVAGLAAATDIGLLYVDGDADLATPGSSGSGVLDAMGMAHLLGLGAPALAGLGPRHPLLPADHAALFGSDPAELDGAASGGLPRAVVRQDPTGAAAAALAALEPRVEAFLLHFDVGALDSGELPLADFPHFPGLSLDQAMQALTVLAASPKLAGVVITEINPDHDPDRRHLRLLADRLAEALTGC
jgi:arginase